MYCTQCNKKIKEKYEVSVYLMIERCADGEWEKINNSEVINSESLCHECFLKFTEKILEFKEK